MRFSTVIFDLDGTLTDPGEGILRSIQSALRESGLPEPPPDELRLCVGPPLRDGFLGLGADPEQVETLIASYRRRYREVGMFENEVYPGIPELLAELAARGCRLGVATSKPTSFAEAILEHFGLREAFSAVFGAELDGRRSDKCELLAHVREQMGLSPPETALVGDREFDITAACAESLYPVGALWGYGSRQELLGAGARSLAEKPPDVLHALGSASPTRNP